MNDKEQIKRVLEEHNIVRINSGMVRDMFGNMLEMEEEGTGGIHSFPITDPSLIQELDSLTPQQMESLVNFLKDGLLELELRDGEVKDE